MLDSEETFRNLNPWSFSDDSMENCGAVDLCSPSSRVALPLTMIFKTRSGPAAQSQSDRTLHVYLKDLASTGVSCLFILQPGSRRWRHIPIGQSQTDTLNRLACSELADHSASIPPQRPRKQRELRALYPVELNQEAQAFECQSPILSLSVRTLRLGCLQSNSTLCLRWENMFIKSSRVSTSTRVC